MAFQEVKGLVHCLMTIVIIYSPLSLQNGMTSVKFWIEKSFLFNETEKISDHTTCPGKSIEYSLYVIAAVKVKLVVLVNITL